MPEISRNVQNARFASDVVSVKDFGATGDGSTDVTALLNTALAVGGYIYLPKGSGAYIISDELTLVADTILEFEAGTEIKILNAGDTINSTGFGVFDIDDIDNVKIIGNGLTITGVRTGSGIANVNFGVKIAGATNVVVTDVYTVDMAGDGFYFAGSSDNGAVDWCSDVWIYRCKSTTAMRNGYSVVAADNLWLVDCQGLSTNGKDPESGIDIETDGADAVIRNVNILNMVCSDNLKADFSVILGGNTTPSTIDPDIKLVNCTSRDSTTNVETIAFRILNHKPTYADNGNLQLIDCTAHNVNNMGLFIRNIDSTSTPVYIENMTLIDTALTAAANIKDPGTDLAIGDSPFNMDVNSATYTAPGGVHINGLRVVDNTRDRGPYYINSSFNPWTDVKIKRLDWTNSVGTTTLPFIQAASDVTIDKVGTPLTIPRTANVTLSTRYSGWDCTNTGASGAVVFTLPAITASFTTTEFLFRVTVAQVLRIDPNASDSIHVLGNGDGKYIEASAIGTWIRIKYHDATGWEVETNNVAGITAEV